MLVTDRFRHLPLFFLFCASCFFFFFFFWYFLPILLKICCYSFFKIRCDESTPLDRRGENKPSGLPISVVHAAVPYFPSSQEIRSNLIAFSLRGVIVDSWEN